MSRVVFIALVIISLVSSSCKVNGSSAFTRSSGKMVSRQQVMEPFDKLELKGNFSATLRESESYSLSIRADEDLMSLMLLEVEEGTLEVSLMGEKRYGDIPLVELVVESPSLKAICCAGSVELLSDSIMSFDTLNVESAGVLKMDLDVVGALLAGELAGASTINLKGEVAELNLDVPGAAKISAFQLSAQKVNLDMAGAGKAQVCANEFLKVNLAGAGMVSYKGNPDQVFSNISGIGRVRKAE